MQKIILTIGLPASGKSTWARQFIKENPNYKIVCRDDLRAMFDDGVWSQKNEETIRRTRDKIIYNLLDSGYNVIVADTNLTSKGRDKIKHVAVYAEQTLNRKVIIEEKSFLDVSIDECIKRDLVRPNSVGARVICDMASRLNIEKNPSQNINYNLPRAYLVDVDGTLAEMNGRGPFDWDKVDTDLPNFSVIETVNSLNRSKIIIMSGRDSVAKTKTIEWLDKHQVSYDEVLMRAEGDMRSDDIVKKELYDNHIKDVYCVMGVFDDRPKVVRMWREMGLTVFDVKSYGYEF